ncbi:MAG TPA: type II toxin-antitoxin system RelE/ParE family toxin [Acidobacteriaceae bacterium]
MQAHPRQVEVYGTVDGHFPYDEWLDGLRDQRARYSIQKRIDRVEEGNFGDCKPVGEGVHELRIDFGPGYRVYFAEDGPKIVLLLCGGDKADQKRNIRTAIKYWRDYKS